MQSCRLFSPVSSLPMSPTGLIINHLQQHPIVPQSVHQFSHGRLFHHSHPICRQPMPPYSRAVEFPKHSGFDRRLADQHPPPASVWHGRLALLVAVSVKIQNILARHAVDSSISP